MRSLIQNKETQSNSQIWWGRGGVLKIRLKDILLILNREEISQVTELGACVLTHLGLCGHDKPSQ